jgi:threonine synthase
MCTRCGARYERDEVRYLCPSCENAHEDKTPLSGVLSTEFDYMEAGRNFDEADPDWSPFIAVDPEYWPVFSHGNTPFHRVPRLAGALRCADLWIKNDGLNPSGSLKDRASYLIVAEANRLGIDTIVCASTGNAASALAAVCASAGKRALIFLPASAPKAKLAQILLYGACAIPILGTYDDAFRLSLEYSAQVGGLNRNTAYHPLTIEGKKTVAFEIWMQNGFRVPDAIVAPVGDGVIISGVYKGFCDLVNAGLADRMPRLIAVQAERSDAVIRLMETGSFEPAFDPSTVADSISVSVPSNALMAVAAVQSTGGCAVRVTDDEIMCAQQQLAELSGLFAEPSAAAALAGLEKLLDEGKADRREQIVLLITGHGLKDVDAVMKRIFVPDPVEPVLDEAMKVVRAGG